MTVSFRNSASARPIGSFPADSLPAKGLISIENAREVESSDGEARDVRAACGGVKELG